ncbi:hypothetical protein ALPO108162_07625 [Alicyclobacillus pomorum]
MRDENGFNACLPTRSSEDIKIDLRSVVTQNARSTSRTTVMFLVSNVLNFSIATLPS